MHPLAGAPALLTQRPVCQATAPTSLGTSTARATRLLDVTPTTEIFLFFSDRGRIAALGSVTPHFMPRLAAGTED